MSNTRTVFSTDPKDKVNCPDCKRNLTECKCLKQQRVDPAQFTVVLRLEKNGRGGKTVTILDKLPRNETYLKELCREIKARCATGGTHRFTSDQAVIEIQGDKLDLVKKILTQKSIKFKGF